MNCKNRRGGNFLPPGDPITDTIGLHAADTHIYMLVGPFQDLENAHGQSRDRPKS